MLDNSRRRTAYERQQGERNSSHRVELGSSVEIVGRGAQEVMKLYQIIIAAVRRLSAYERNFRMLLASVPFASASRSVIGKRGGVKPRAYQIKNRTSGLFGRFERLFTLIAAANGPRAHCG